MIEVKEYWPTFVDRDESTRRITVVEDEADVILVGWLAAKNPDYIEWDKWGGFVFKDYGKEGKFVLALLKHVEHL